MPQSAVRAAIGSLCPSTHSRRYASSKLFRVPRRKIRTFCAALPFPTGDVLGSHISVSLFTTHNNPVSVVLSSALAIHAR